MACKRDPHTDSRSVISACAYVLLSTPTLQAPIVITAFDPSGSGGAWPIPMDCGGRCKYQMPTWMRPGGRQTPGACDMDRFVALPRIPDPPFHFRCIGAAGRAGTSHREGRVMPRQLHIVKAQKMIPSLIQISVLQIPNRSTLLAPSSCPSPPFLPWDTASRNLVARPAALGRGEAKRKECLDTLLRLPAAAASGSVCAG